MTSYGLRKFPSVIWAEIQSFRPVDDSLTRTPHSSIPKDVNFFSVDRTLLSRSKKSILKGNPSVLYYKVVSWLELLFFFLIGTVTYWIENGKASR